MKLEQDSHKRGQQVNEVLSICQGDQGERQPLYQKARQFYLHGNQSGADARHNKIKPICRRLSSFLYSAESVHFWLSTPPDDEDESTIEEAEAASEALADRWKDTGLDLLFGDAVLWGLIYGCSILHIAKERDTSGGVMLVGHLIHPASFGVFRPDEPDLLRQEAVSMTTLLSMPEVRRRIKHLPHSHQFEILQNLQQGGQGGQAGGRLYHTSSAPDGSTQGVAPAIASGKYAYTAKTATPLYQMDDVYCWDDEAGDYHVFTVCGGLIVHDRPLKEVSVPGRVPFCKVCPFPLPDFFWGLSLVDDMEKLQGWFSLRVSQLDRVVAKILDPPKAAYGIGALQEERLRALNTSGGIVPMPNKAQASIEEFKPDVPEAVFEMLDRMGDFFIESAGMQPSMFGKQEPGTRTEGMLANAMRVSAAEIRDVAMRVERQVEDCANLLWKCMRYYQREELVTRAQSQDPHKPAGQRRFLPADFPEDARVEVDGHSASPLFHEDHAQEVQALFRMGAIDQQTAVEMLPVPMKSKIIHRLARVLAWKQIGQAIAQAQQAAKRQGSAKGP